MNWIERLAFGLKMMRLGDSTARSQYVRAIAAQNGPNWPRLDIYSAQADEYARSSWVYVAVTRIVEAMALVPFGVYGLHGEKQTALANHPLEQLLRHPNPMTSQFELLESTFGYLELNGNAYWMLVGDGAPSEIWVLRPDRVRIVVDPVNYVKGYVYMTDGEDVPLKREEVIHFKRWHPRNDHYGLSAMEAAALASQGDRAMSEYNRNFFSHERATPAGMVTIKENIPDADFERIQREFRESYSGSKRSTAFIRGAKGDVEWSNMGLTQQDMDFMRGRDFSRDEIMSIFGVPLSMYDRNSTQSTAQVARRVFLEDTLWPKLTRFSQKLTQELCPFYGNNLVLMPDEIRDTAPDIAEIEAARGYMSVNEMRDRFWSLGAVPWGDGPLDSAGQITKLNVEGDGQ